MSFEKHLAEEVRAFSHDALVQTYVWANSTTYLSFSDPDLRRDGEEWARAVEAQGDDVVLEVLMAGAE